MEKIVIQLAGINISVACLFQETYTYLSEFKTKNKGKYEVGISELRFIQERTILEQKIPWKKFYDYEIEINALYHELSLLLLREDVIVIHGVLLRMKNVGILFTAPSGIGKSTQAALWVEHFPNDVVIINGDKPLLKITEEGVVAFGSPWKGKEKIGNKECVPLKKICYVRRAKENSIKLVEWNGDSLSWLLTQSQLYESQNSTIERVRLFKKAIPFVSLYELKCNISDMAVITAYDGFFK